MPTDFSLSAIKAEIASRTISRLRDQLFGSVLRDNGLDALLHRRTDDDFEIVEPDGLVEQGALVGQDAQV